MPRITNVVVLDGYRLSLNFDDGANGTVNLADLAGKGVFELWLDREVFEQVQIGPSGELQWGNEVDLCPDALYLKATGKSPEEVFPALKGQPARA